jgi:hypothetical protein
MAFCWETPPLAAVDRLLEIEETFLEEVMSVVLAEV